MAVRQSNRHRGCTGKAIEATYDGTCRIYGMKPIRDPVTKVTRQRSFKQDGISYTICLTPVDTAAGSDTGLSVAMVTIKLFPAPEPVVPPGSRIEVLAGPDRELCSEWKPRHTPPPRDSSGDMKKSWQRAESWNKEYKSR